MFELDNVKNAAILRDLLNVWTWQRQKRSNSARLPQCLNLTTSKTKQFCETSSFFKVDNIKNEAIPRDFLIFRSWKHQKRNNSARRPSKMESWVQSWRPRTNAFCDFSSPPVWSTAPATKKWLQVVRSAAPVTQNHLSKPENLRLQNATPLRKSAPGPPNSSDEDVSCTVPATENASFHHACHRFWKCYKTFTFCSLLTRSTIPCACETTSERPKVVRSWCALYILTSKCALRHNGVHFFDISISKSGPELVCFENFDLEVCFAPQRRALFRHRNFQKWSGAGVLCTFWLWNVLRAITACTFSTSQLPKVLRTCGALYILTWKRASRHNGVQFFISHPARWLRTRRFSEPTSRPSGQCFATFLPSRAPASSFFWLSLLWSSLFCSSLFYSSLLSDSSHLCFSSVHIVRSLTSKLPSIIHIYIYTYTYTYIYITCTSMCMYGKVMNCCIWMMM